MKIRIEISEVEKNREKQWNQRLVLWDNKIDKPIVRLIHKKRKKTQITSINNEQCDITRDSTDIKRNIMNNLIPINLTLHWNGKPPWMPKATKTHLRRNR